MNELLDKESNNGVATQENEISMTSRSGNDIIIPQVDNPTLQQCQRKETKSGNPIIGSVENRSDDCLESDLLNPTGGSDSHAATKTNNEDDKNQGFSLQVGDTLEDIFPNIKKNKLKSFSKNRKKKKKITVARFSCSPLSQSNAGAEMKKCSRTVASTSQLISPSIMVEKEPQVCRYQDNTFDFYSEIHEDQDIETIELVKGKTQIWLEKSLDTLAEKEKEMKKDLSHKLKDKWENERKKFLAQVYTWKQSTEKKQEKQKASLAEQYQRSIKTKENEARDGMKFLLEKNTAQIDSINRKYQQQPWTQESERIKAVEMKDLQKKFHEIQQNLQRKLQAFLEVKEVEYKKTYSKLQKHHQKRKAEFRLSIQKFQTKAVEKHEHHRVCYEECQAKKIETLKRDILNNCNNLLHSSNLEFLSNLRITPEDKQDIVLPKGANEKKSYSENLNGAAVLRYKCRKTVLSKKCIPAVLHIEFQNEGLTLTLVSDKSVKGEKGLNCDFIPWGFKARQLLANITCGELSIMQSVNVEGCTDGLQGGQIKCIISDKRRPDRKSTPQQILERGIGSINESEKSVSLHKQNVETASRDQVKCENLVAKTLRELQLTKQTAMSLQSQMKNSDGRLNLNEENHKKLRMAFTKYDNAEQKMKISQQQLASAKKNKNECVENLKRALDDYKVALGSEGANEISSIIEETKAVMNKKRHQGCGDEKIPVDQLPGLGHLEQKNITTVLRPTKSRTSADLMSFMKDTGKIDIRAEESFLLSIHPFCDEIPSPAPSMDHAETKPWAEPGYQLNLAVPSSQNTKKVILPSRLNEEFFRYMHSEFSSTQGRQVSSLIARQHYHSIDHGNQSSTATISMLGVEDQDILKGYEFQLPKKRHIKKLRDDTLDADDNYVNSAKKRKKDIGSSNFDSLSFRSVSTFQEKQIKTSNSSFKSQPTLQSNPNSNYHSNNHSMNRISDRYDTLNTLMPQIPQPPHLQYQPQSSYHGSTQYAMQQRIPQIHYHQMPNIAQPYQRTSNQTSETHSFQRKG